MALNNFSTDLFVYTVNGRPINDWGETATPLLDDPIDPKTVLRRGQGGGAIRLNRLNPGRRHTLFLNPGSPDSNHIQNLMNAGTNITASTTQVGTLEASIAAEGAIVNDASKGRGGTTITDDSYIIEFNVSNQTKGGV